MWNLTLHQRFIVSPVMGLILIIVLTATYLWYAENHNVLMKRIVDNDVQLLDRYTDLFTGLSRHHMELYQLLYDAPGLDEGSIYDRGRNILDGIYASAEKISTLAKQESVQNQLKAFKLEELKVLIRHLDAYKASAISAVEMSSVALVLASSYLAEANKHFSYMHENFARRLDEARQEMRDLAESHIEYNRLHTEILAIAGLVLSFIVLLFGFVSSSRVSARLREQIATLNRLSQVETSSYLHKHRDEIDHMSAAIEVFRRSLETIHEQENKLEAKNRELLNEIQIRKQAEQSLLSAKDQLEDKVLERTQSLTEANRALSEEIDQRLQAEERLSIYKQVIDSTDEAVLITDKHARIIEVNPAYQNKLGYARREIIGQTPGRLAQSGLHDKHFYAEMWKSLQTRQHWSGEIWNKHKNNSVLPFWLTINAILDEAGEITNFIGLFRDISALKKAEKDLEQLAFYDPLTGLPNRVLFNDRLSQTIINAKQHNSYLAVMFLDLDHFKDVNDTLGHSMGDALLVQVTDRLSAVLRTGDTISRLGGDEFTIILPEIRSIDDAIVIAKSMIKSLKKPFNLSEHQVRIGGSLGIAFYPEHGTDAERLKKNADVAMYQAKELGRNRYQLYNATLQKENMKRMALVEDMRMALENDEFLLFYQPIINLGLNQVHEVEALIRWKRRGKTWISPEEFIPVAEEYGLIGDIDKWVLHQACAFAAQYSDDLMVHVNLSAGLFQNATTPKLVVGCLEKTNLAAGRLCVEITETAVITEPALAQNILEQINRMGVVVALDDFGTGYSSLTHLTRFPLQRLKIDRSFVSALLQGDATEAVVRSMLDLARHMNITVVSEGVEKLEQHEFLTDMGCNYGQGYFYAAPMSERDTISWLTSHDA